MPADTNCKNTNVLLSMWPATVRSGTELARLVWFIAAIVATASQFPANETKFFGVWHKSSFQLAGATAAAAAAARSVYTRSLARFCLGVQSARQAGRQSVDCIKWIYCQLLNYALCSRTIYYLHFYCYFCNLLALPTRRRLDSLPVPSSLCQSRGSVLLPCPLFVRHFYCHSVSVYFYLPSFFLGNVSGGSRRN